MKYMKEDCVAICKYCSHRHYGFPRNCCRCGNTKFRRASLRKGEVIVMANNHVQRRGGPVEFGSTPKLGSIDQANGASHRAPLSPSAEALIWRTKVKGRCPHCLHHILIRRGFRYNKLKRIQIFGCLKCNRRFTHKTYRHHVTPDFVIDEFVDIFSSKKFYSTRRISDLIFIKTGYKISFQTIARWENLYRKGKLWPRYFKNSKLNSLHKPNLEYIPKITIYQQTEKHIGTFTLRREWSNQATKKVSNLHYPLPQGFDKTWVEAISE